MTLVCPYREDADPASQTNSFRPCQNTATQPPLQVTHGRGKLTRHQSPVEVSPALRTAKMRKQRHMLQIKEQNQTPEKKLSKMETSNQPDAGFKTFVIRMLNELRKRVDELSENFNKQKTKMEIESIRKNW